MRLRTPPGRAGRLWLRERLAAARKAADLMDHKRRELEAERQRVRTIATDRERAWRAAAAEAAKWLRRVDAAGSEQSIRLATSLTSSAAEVDLQWRQVMGVRYAADYALRVPPAPAIAFLEGGPALAPALAAYRRAVDAAVAHAVARTALTHIQADMDRTKRRLRALELRAIPAHETALGELELALDERSREDAVAARWAADGAPSVPGVGKGP